MSQLRILSVVQEPSPFNPFLPSHFLSLLDIASTNLTDATFTDDNISASRVARAEEVTRRAPLIDLTRTQGLKRREGEKEGGEGDTWTLKVSFHPLHWKEAKKDRGRKEEIKGKANFASVRAIAGGG